MAEKMRKIESTCRKCKATDKFELPEAGFEARAKGTTFLNAFPDIEPARLRQMIEHLCPACQDAANAARNGQ